MPRRSRGLMSDALKYDLARELGVMDVVSTEGWGGVSAKNCGNLVKLAVARAQAAMAAESLGRSPRLTGYGGAPTGGPFPYPTAGPGPAEQAQRI